jgi:hypothetical protein
MLDSIVDASDPDISQAQTLHAFQTAEALRAADMPRWMILTGLIHDAGKVLANMSEPQWAVVGDTFPVGELPRAAALARSPADSRASRSRRRRVPLERQDSAARCGL